MLDVVIKSGALVDGSGAPPRRVDIGIKDGRIVGIGEVLSEAVLTLDASSKVVTPGFVDIHTHFDAQVFWDGALTPSPLHGVTSVIAGNCGFTIAPLSNRPDDGRYLMRMLARVEGIPIESLRQGVPWSWRTTSEYFEEVEPRLGINAGFMIGHSAIRRIAMGDDACEREATNDEINVMTTLLGEGLEAGGIGFSSSWARTHNDAEGRMVPSRYASKSELVQLAKVTGNYEGTSLEFVPMIGPFEPWAVELMADLSIAARRPLNWNVLTVNAASREAAFAKLEAGDDAQARGGKVIALSMPILSGIRRSFASGFLLDAIPGWENAMHLSRDEKLKSFQDKGWRDHLNVLAQRPENRMGTDWATMVIYDVVAPQNEQYRGRTVGEIATNLGCSDWDALCDIVLADELLTSFGSPPPVETDADWRARVDIWRDRRAAIGGSDAGAHLDMLASFNYPTVVLGEAVRKRKLLSLEEAVNLMTDVPAKLYGLAERGLVRNGYYADLVVLDPTTVGSGEIAMRFDLPGDAGRLYADSNGIEHVLVNGRAIVRHGKLTSERSGSLLRSGRDTKTPELV